MIVEIYIFKFVFLLFFKRGYRTKRKSKIKLYTINNIFGKDLSLDTI